jgi:hypothetical protein
MQKRAKSVSNISYKLGAMWSIWIACGIIMSLLDLSKGQDDLSVGN